MQALLRSAGLLQASARQKSRGQNFLRDADCARRIAQSCDVGGGLSSSPVVEIGAGAGALTRALFHQGARRIVAIEAEARLADFLRRWSEGLSEGRELEVVEGDARTMDYGKILQKRDGEDDAVIVGNLPYSVGTVILRRLLEREGEGRHKVMVLMFQREVAERITAEVGDAAYGRLSVLVGLRSRVERCFDVAPSSFVPVPKVVSCVVRFFPRGEREHTATSEEYALVAEMTGLLFSYRRKKMSTILRMAGREDWRKAGEDAGIDLSRRAGEARGEEWLRWAKAAKQEQ